MLLLLFNHMFDIFFYPMNPERMEYIEELASSITWIILRFSPVYLSAAFALLTVWCHS